MPISEFIKADILATCNALGKQKGLIYEKSEECLECLRDLLRYLRNDDDEHSIIRYLGSIRLLQTDIIPLIKQYHREQDIFEVALRLLVALTNPALLLYKEELPDDKLERNVYLQIISCLQTYKKALVDDTFWKALYVRLFDLLNKSTLERTDEQNLTIERILITVRNVLHVPSDESSTVRTDDDYSLHDKLLLSIHESKLDLLVLYMAAKKDEHDYCLHVLEIIFLMLREHTAADLARTSDVRSDAEKEEDLMALEIVRQREQHTKNQKLKSLTPRFSRFNGVYQVKNMKSLSDKDYIAHKLVNIDEVKFDAQKSARRTPKNRLPARDQNETRRSKFTIRLLLKKICIEFLKSYNILLVSVKRQLQHNKANENDDTYFLWVVRYFMEFNRLYNFNVAFIAETISMQTFHHIQTEINNYLEMMLTDKKKIMFWSRRTQLGVSAYKELLETLRVMERSEMKVVRDSADLIIKNVFYVIEYRELLYTLLTQYDEVKFPLSYLAELVESAYLFLKMLENHSKRHSELIVQTKKRTVRRRKKKKSNPEEPVETEQLLNDQWETISGDLFAATQGEVELPTNLTPFDGASNISFTEQKIEAVYKIRDAIIANDAASAVALLRAARELWPEGDAYGNATTTAEEEVNILKEIHFSNVQRTSTEVNTVEQEESDPEEEEMEASMSSVAEKKLEIDEVYKKYASPKVVQPCCLLLANYRNNSDQTNTSLIKFIHKIAWNCKMYALFFQSTVFVTFHKIFNDPDVNFRPIIKEFYRFGKFIMSKFFEVAKQNPKIFVEMLFWKGAREVYELEEGYGASENRSSKLTWTEEEDEELRYLFEENKDIHIEGQDVADIICASMNKKSKSKKQIISALKRLGLINNAKDLKPHLSKEWRETEVLELTHLFNDYKDDSEDIMSDIRERLSIKRPRKAIVEKLLELNLISDRKEVRKKKSRKQNKNSDSSDSDSSGDESELSDSLIVQKHKNVVNRSDSESDADDENFFNRLAAERNADNSVTNADAEAGETATSEIISTNRNIAMEVWDEQEVMELNRLFEEHKSSNKVLKNIIKGLTIKRSKSEIVGKLLEMGLIKDKIELKRKDKKHDKNAHKQQPKGSLDRKKKSSKVWEEQEVVELTHLFNEFQGSENIMEIILQKLTVKRAKPAVVEKLLEIGLIQDKREVRKKRTSKKISNAEESNSDEHSDDSTVEDITESLPASSEHKKRFKRRILSDSSDDEQLESKISDISGASIVNLSKSSKKADGGKRPPKVWNEQEVIQLHNLFRQHQGSPDVVQNISDKLTIKRPREKIIEKLLELGLIKDRKEIRKKRTLKSSKSNVPEFWDESEVIQLHNLYSEHKNAADVVQNIVNNLPAKHSKEAVIEKLLQLGLVQDRKELKKRGNTINKEKHSDISKVWNESEVIELYNLFEQYKSSADVVESIVNNMTIKRSKKMVTQKLLAFGLLKNQKKPVSSEVQKTWDESEIIQLHNLFSLYRNSDNVIQDILDNLSIKRSEKMIIGKMLELGLIKDKKEVNNQGLKAKSKNESNDSKVWNEMEIVELHNLFNEHKTSDDPIQNIVGNLTINRPRKKVVEKLIELGLIKNEKEISRITNSSNVNKVVRSSKTKSADTTTDKNIEDSSGDELPLINSISTKTNVKTLPDSSDDDELPLINSFSTKTNVETLPDSSDDDELPLINSVSTKTNVETLPDSSDDDELPLINSVSTKTNVETLPDSSDADDLPVSHKKVNMSDMRKKLQILLSDSSDDELKLNGTMSKSSNEGNQDIDQNIKIAGNDVDPLLKEMIPSKNTSNEMLNTSSQGPSSSWNSITTEKNSAFPSSSSIFTNSSVNDAAETISLNLKSSKAKRKRIVFSDESSDDNDLTEVNSNKKSSLIDEDKSAENSPNFKLKKKKICVLQDSDDSS